MDDIYSRYLAALCQHQEGGGQEAVADMQRAMLEALESGEPLPEEMQSALVVAFRMVLNREIPYLFERRCGPPASTLAHSCVKDAVRYIREARTQGDSYDSKPVDTVVEHYGVDKRTVYRWLHEFEDEQLPILSNVLNDADGIRKRMEIGGRLYKDQSMKRGGAVIPK